MHVSTFYYACDKFCGKLKFFVSCVKRQTKISRATCILAPKISFLHTTQKICFSHKTTLWEHRVSRSTRKKFHRIFLIFETSFKTYFKNWEHVLPGAKTMLPMNTSFQSFKEF
jgi:hypothetical protein